MTEEYKTFNCMNKETADMQSDQETRFIYREVVAQCHNRAESQYTQSHDSAVEDVPNDARGSNFFDASRLTQDG